MEADTVVAKATYRVDDELRAELQALTKSKANRIKKAVFGLAKAERLPLLPVVVETVLALNTTARGYHEEKLVGDILKLLEEDMRGNPELSDCVLGLVRPEHLTSLDDYRSSVGEMILEMACKTLRPAARQVLEYYVTRHIRGTATPHSKRIGIASRCALALGAWDLVELFESKEIKGNRELWTTLSTTLLRARYPNLCDTKQIGWGSELLKALTTDELCSQKSSYASYATSYATRVQDVRLGNTPKKRIKALAKIKLVADGSGWREREYCWMVYSHILVEFLKEEDASLVDMAIGMLVRNTNYCTFFCCEEYLVSCIREQFDKGRFDEAQRRQLRRIWADLQTQDKFPCLADETPATDYETPVVACNTDLENVILEDIDNMSNYLVYGDWLQSEGDPWGELIAMQCSFAADKENTAAKIRANDLFVALEGHFLGTLGPEIGVEMTLGWRWGCIHNATVKYSDASLTVQALEKLLILPVAEFLQELDVPCKNGECLEVETFLLQSGKLGQLRKLTIGKPGSWRASDAIYKVFPFLESDPLVLWDTCTTFTQKLRGSYSQSLANAPVLVPLLKNGPAPVDLQLVLKGLEAELDRGHPTNMCHALQRNFTAESIDGLLLAMSEQLHDQRTGPAVTGTSTPSLRPEDWVLKALNILGGNECGAYWCTRLFFGSISSLLTRLDTAKADSAIVALLEGVDSNGILTTLANRKGISVEKLRDSSNDWEHENVAPAAQTYLQGLMLGGHRLSSADAEQYIFLHSNRGPIASQLVWGVFHSNGRFTAVRRVEGGFRDVAGVVVQLDEQDRLGVLHPAEMTKLDLEEWRTVLHSLKISPPLLQLERPIFDVSPCGLKQRVIDRYKDTKVSSFTISTHLIDGANWSVRGVQGMGHVQSWNKIMPRDKVVAIVEISSSGVGDVYFTETGFSDKKRDLVADSGESLMCLGDLHRVTRSEVLYDLERTTTDGTTLSSGVSVDSLMTQPDGFPILETTRGNNWRCIACGDLMKRGTARVVVAQEIETNAHDGEVKSFMHLSCAISCEELSGIKDLSGTLRANAVGKAGQFLEE